MKQIVKDRQSNYPKQIQGDLPSMKYHRLSIEIEHVITEFPL